MTEYDYSPDAYERYLATQQRIARWVDNTHRHSPSNPFVSTPTAEPQAATDYFPSSPPQSQSRTNESSPNSYHPRSDSRRPSSHTTYSRPDISRSQSTPISIPRSSGNHQSSSHSSSRNSRSRSNHTHSSSRSQSTHQSSSSSRSSSSRYTSGSNATSTVSYKTISANKNSATYVTPSNHRPTCVMIDGGRGGYVIVPQTGTRLEVLNPESYITSRPSPSRSRSTQSEKPLLKRLFSGFTSSPGGSR